MAILASVAVWAARDDASDFPYLPYDHPALGYVKEAPDEPIAQLQKKLDLGQAKLEYNAKWGYLPSLLKRLDINVDSQMLVFSRTSFQGPKISPISPRALYFNDNVAVGFVPNGNVMELTALDPKRGIIFYTMDREKTAKPMFLRRTQECMNCHLIPGTLYVPSLLATSVVPRPDGSLRFTAAATIVDGRTPLDQRWGGWYVTGTSGDLQHRGNAFARDDSQPTVFDRTDTLNLKSLTGRLETSTYLAPTSDLIALMTLEHQTRMTAFLTRLGWEVRLATQEGKLDEFHDRLEFLTDQLVSYMLFVDEARMPSPMAGVSSFTSTFAARGPRDREGRSLRDFDLQTRLFRYPLSYMIYDAAFDGLPDLARDRVYRKLFDVLGGQDPDKRYSRLTTTDRKAIREILLDTKTTLPPYWRAAVK